MHAYVRACVTCLRALPVYVRYLSACITCACVTVCVRSACITCACVTCLRALPVCVHYLSVYAFIRVCFFINKHRSCVRVCVCACVRACVRTCVRVCVCVYQLPFGGRNIQELYIAVTRKEPFYPGFLSPDAISFNKKVTFFSPCGVLVETFYPRTSSAIAV